jgi:PEP-CTERM motif
MKKLVLGLAATLLSTASGAAVVLVETLDPGFYNNSIGTTLNLSNTGADICAEPFPSGNDCATPYPSAPNLSAAAGILGNWLTNPLSLNSNWSATKIPIPNSWAVNTEVAIIYQFDTLAATNVVGSFGVDNGIFVWLDGVYLFGARGPGGPTVGEYNVPIGDLSAGTHFLQILLEDHGSINGYNVQISADTFIPGPGPGIPVTAPATLALIGLGLAGLAYRQSRRRVNV